MAFPDLAVNLVYTVLCLVPGFISLETLIHAADLDVELTEFERTMWSLVASGVSLSLLYFLYVVGVNIATDRLAVVPSVSLAWVDLVAIYPVLLLVAVLVGYVGAKVLVRRFGVPLGTRRETSQ